MAEATFDYEATMRALRQVTAALPLTDAAPVLTAHQHRSLRRAIREASEHLERFASATDPIAMPVSTYNPGDFYTFAQSIGDQLRRQERVPLGSVASNRFYGSGIYALYYNGAFDAYQPLIGSEHPIYVGKAEPAERGAPTPQEQKDSLWGRLNEHAESIGFAQSTLSLDDFDCRFLVVASGWQTAAEDHLIHLFKPIWNKEIGICQGIGKHGDAADTRRNRNSAWDTLHPGRPWAAGAQPNRRSGDEIKELIAEHFAEFPPLI